LLAIMRTPFRFRTKRNLWPYAGLAVVKHSSANQVFKNGKLQRSKKAPMTRGLNRNHNPLLKAVFKGAATAAASAPGPLGEYSAASVSRGVDKDLAKVTLVSRPA
jgi:hypothetical protein